jgi:hypothetical protein
MNDAQRAEAEISLTAHHEAGHAVAALMRGGGEVVSITIVPTPEYFGFTHTRVKIFDTAFLTYAGPLAEARSHWPEGVPLDDEYGDDDDDDVTFGDYVTAAFIRNADGDLEKYVECWKTDPALAAIDSGLLSAPEGVSVPTQGSVEAGWDTELERYAWPAVRALAVRLLDVRTMTGEEVVGLVDPFLA